MELIPIQKTSAENEAFIHHPLCQDSLYMTMDFYKKVGFTPPWICYYAQQNGELVGSAGIKGKPIEGKIEIAYGTFETFRQQGIGGEICKALVNLSLSTDPSIQITARTLPEENFSTKILRKNHFILLGTVIDPEDGEVWEWEYVRN